MSSRLFRVSRSPSGFAFGDDLLESFAVFWRRTFRVGGVEDLLLFGAGFDRAQTRPPVVDRGGLDTEHRGELADRLSHRLLQRGSFEAGPFPPSYHAAPYFQLLNWEMPTVRPRYATAVRFLPMPLAGND